jgi:flavin reductase (DIM6/NTAB) family NADH-FMN oxidoreductase RutF
LHRITEKEYDKGRNYLMEKEFWRPGNMLYPIPAIMVSCADEQHRPNIITVAWAGTICSNPAMVSVSIRKERYSYDIIKNSREFVINLVTKELVRQADYCGVKSGREVDKFKEMHLTPMKGKIVSAPLIGESPVSLECTVKDIIPLGTHDMFLGEVVNVAVDKKYMDEKGKFHLNKSGLIVYSHGEYYGLGDLLGKFGYSVKKKK